MKLRWFLDQSGIKTAKTCPAKYFGVWSKNSQVRFRYGIKKVLVQNMLKRASLVPH